MRCAREQGMRHKVGKLAPRTRARGPPQVGERCAREQGGATGGRASVRESKRAIVACHFLSCFLFGCLFLFSCIEFLCLPLCVLFLLPPSPLIKQASKKQQKIEKSFGDVWKTLRAYLYSFCIVSHGICSCSCKSMCEDSLKTCEDI